jgi:hypothetical protein
VLTLNFEALFHRPPPPGDPGIPGLLACFDVTALAMKERHPPRTQRTLLSAIQCHVGEGG